MKNALLQSSLGAHVLLAGFVAWGQPAAQTRQAIQESIQRDYAYLFDLYRDLHRNPELSFQEQNTARRLADELRQAGFEVTQNVGGHGVVGVLKNGDGPTLLLRTDLDALPVAEQTGLPYSSKATATDDSGTEVPVMHACGHDVHITSLVGAARQLTKFKDRWSGTLVLIGQPAEERGAGAKAMLADGLFERFPKPDYCVAQHVAADMPAGTVGYVSGYAAANVDSVDITVRGIGGHGAYPHTTKDPIVLASEIVMALQTIVSREVSPIEPAVVTVGSIHGGAKHNVIPSEVKLQLTVRSYTDEVREQILAAIKRITRGLGQAAGLPEDLLPVVTVRDEYTPAGYNDPALTERLVGAMKTWIGQDNLIQRKPTMGGEDFGRYGRTEDHIPICMLSVGAVRPEVLEKSRQTGNPPPSLHSPLFAPAPEATLKTGVTFLTAAVLELAGKK